MPSTGRPALSLGVTDEERFLTRRETEALLEAGVQSEADRAAAHAKVHETDRLAVDTALVAANRERILHDEAHDKAHEAHAAAHEQGVLAVDKALAAVQRESEIHSVAHSREHGAHEQRHEDQALAVSKSDSALDKRLESIDRRFTDASKHTDDRYEENRRRIEALEKGDVRGEGKELGRNTMVGIIVGAIGLVGTLLGILVVASNVLSAR